MPQKPYVFGSSITPIEFAQVRARLVPDWRLRCKKVPPAAFLAAVQSAIPHRLAFEVDRIRGLAFDVGEVGFTYTVIS